MMEIKLKQDGWYINNNKFRWYKLHYYPVLAVASHLIRAKENISGGG